MAVGALLAHARSGGTSTEVVTTTTDFDDNDVVVDYDPFLTDDDVYNNNNNNNGGCGPKEWPHLIGVRVTEARTQILASNVCVVVQIVPAHYNDPVEDVYDPERVRLYMDRDTGTVVRVPKVG